MGMYPVLYRLGIRPWERYAEASSNHVAARFDAELADRPDPPGRALDLGCGRGMHTPALAARGWEAVGVDLVPTAIDQARRRDPTSTYAVGDVTALPDSLGTFDHFVDIGCFQALDADQRRAAGRSITARARDGATLLMLEFGRVWFSFEGTSRAEVEEAFGGWDLLGVEPAPTEGLGWPLSRTRPSWYRLRLRERAAGA
ncbi:class I SAM-dependent methyltransferase [Agrococcus sp. DT81.2]|uniref:class I SAM-dependent methyltransferase n=1 Tax=Agrococcus sp. DT81.2 TaxID=3393414 RepID=UPI003CE47A44